MKKYLLTLALVSLWVPQRGWQRKTDKEKRIRCPGHMELRRRPLPVHLLHNPTSRRSMFPTAR